MSENMTRAEHKAQMEAKYGTAGHPAADKCYDLAWDYGHASGFHEIGYYYEDLAALMRPTLTPDRVDEILDEEFDESKTVVTALRWENAIYRIKQELEGNN